VGSGTQAKPMSCIAGLKRKCHRGKGQKSSNPHKVHQQLEEGRAKNKEGVILERLRDSEGAQKIHTLSGRQANIEGQRARAGASKEV